MSHSRTSLEQWRALQAVVDHGGYAQAAAKLNRSQSSVSYAITRLQEQLGVQLLRINGRKAELTEKGEALLRRARHLLQQAAALETFAESLERGWESEIRLVVDAAFPPRLLMDVLRRFRPVSRGSRVQLTQVVMSGADEALEDGWADLVIGGRIPSRFDGELLTEIEFVAVAHPGHALHQYGRALSMGDLEAELQVIISDSGERHKRDSGWLPAEHRWSVTSIENAIEAVRAGLGFSWLPDQRIAPLVEQGELRPLPLREGRSYRSPLYMIPGKPGATGPATRQLAGLLREASLRQE